MSQADEFRKQAAESRKRASEAKSLGQGARDRQRAEGLEQLAANEDWLDGKPRRREAPERTEARPPAQRSDQSQ